MSSSSRIRLLSAQVANKIAAGEVVDRPASVLRELIDNAVDAGASQIDVEIVTGGRKLVSVSDNGGGLGRDDALLCVERHATSKIRDVDDIEKIDTMGFRGEALAAISAVSRFRLVSCLSGEEVGTELTISGGKVQDVRDVGAPTGTTIEVRDLFFNVPARRKFLRTHQTEGSHAREAFIVQALAHPDVGFTLKIDGREAYNLPAGAALIDRIRDVYGREYPENMLAVDVQAAGASISGYVSLPTIHRSDRKEQHVNINGRPTSAPVISYAIREAYDTLVPSGRHPSVFVYVKIDPTAVDVNVHPAKKEVRFRRPSDIRDGLITAIRQTLQRGGGVPKPVAAPMVPAEAFPPAMVEQRLRIDDLPATRSFHYPRIPLAQGVSPQAAATPGAAEPAAPDNASSQDDASAAPWSWCRILGQVGSLYVMMETEEGIVMMDPHAAHERVLYDQFMRAVLAGDVPSQGILVPETIELSPADARQVRGNLGPLKEMGFGISEFGGDAFVVDAMPTRLSGTRPSAILADVATTMEEGGRRGGSENWNKEAIASAACKAAVKANDRLTLEEIEQLVVDLAKTEMPYTCPHGRPTIILTSYRELNRKFGRE